MLSHRHPTAKKNECESDITSTEVPSTTMRRRTRFVTKLKRWILTRYGVLFLISFVVIYINEVLFYDWTQITWPDIDKLANKSTVERLLLVADPQLIGEKDEGFFGFITRNDADRYLAQTFSRAHDYVKPNWVLFLGDIFDEGLSASSIEFHRYFERFDTIFQYKKHEKKYIVIPGDNDVGGEYYGDKKPYLRLRFRNYFGRMIKLYELDDIEFLRLDIDMFESYVDVNQNRIMEQTQNRSLISMFRIVLNHWSLITRGAIFLKPFLNELKPNLILKGDSHHFRVTLHDQRNFTTTSIFKEFFPQSLLPIDLNQNHFVYEISVPTCSYRMGVDRIGYGVLFLDRGWQYLIERILNNEFSNEIQIVRVKLDTNIFQQLLSNEYQFQETDRSYKVLKINSLCLPSQGIIQSTLIRIGCTLRYSIVEIDMDHTMIIPLEIQLDVEIKLSKIEPIISIVQKSVKIPLTKYFIPISNKRISIVDDGSFVILSPKWRRSIDEQHFPHMRTLSPIQQRLSDEKLIFNH
ncbi:hypothetical protein I4U23_025028 [Adineta vaga]|nr:hypothetical protein I4U23_025028 [Adineta vaga]